MGVHSELEALEAFSVFVASSLSRLAGVLAYALRQFLDVRTHLAGMAGQGRDARID
jgi:hypothetical protein